MSTPIAGINQQIFFLLPIAFFFKNQNLSTPKILNGHNLKATNPSLFRMG